MQQPHGWRPPSSARDRSQRGVRGGQVVMALLSCCQPQSTANLKSTLTEPQLSALRPHCSNCDTCASVLLQQLLPPAWQPGSATPGQPGSHGSAYPPPHSPQWPAWRWTHRHACKTPQKEGCSNGSSSMRRSGLESLSHRPNVTSLTVGMLLSAAPHLKTAPVHTPARGTKRLVTAAKHCLLLPLTAVDKSSD